MKLIIWHLKLDPRWRFCERWLNLSGPAVKLFVLYSLSSLFLPLQEFCIHFTSAWPLYIRLSPRGVLQLVEGYWENDVFWERREVEIQTEREREQLERYNSCLAREKKITERNRRLGCEFSWFLSLLWDWSLYLYNLDMLCTSVKISSKWISNNTRNWM